MVPRKVRDMMPALPAPQASQPPPWVSIPTTPPPTARKIWRAKKRVMYPK
jgi:hypothetical protein